MSNLYISLAIIGALILIAIMIYNAWMVRKNTPRKPQPELESGLPTSASTIFDQTQVVNPPELMSNVVLNAQPIIPSIERKPGLDPLIDAIATLKPDQMVLGELALSLMPTTRRAGSKPFGIEGLNARTRMWEIPLPGHHYKLFQAGIQISNRLGSINEIEFSEFLIKTQHFAEAIQAEIEAPDMQLEVARGRELDQFASVHDAQLTFNLRAKSTAWSLGFLQQQAARLGFVPSLIAGKMTLPPLGDNAMPVLNLTFDAQAVLADDPAQSALHEISIHLDVPQVARSERPFVRMRHAVVSLAQMMDGIVVDQNAQAIDPVAMDIIGRELDALYDALDDHDLSAGSAQARRLFS